MKLRTLFALSLLAPTLAFAEAAVGKVTSLEGGGAVRFAEGAGSDQADPGTPAPLKVGDAIELKDRVRVDPKASLKFTLNDGSVVALDKGSVLDISEADFSEQTRGSFGAKLLAGKFWAKVTKALSSSGGKFEVSTDRSVAGVRGTIFRIDVTPVVAHAFPPKTKQVVVQVNEGLVAVKADVKNAKNCTGMEEPSKGPRHQVAGPKQISKEQWEHCFVALQAKQRVTIGDSSWDTHDFDPSKKDSFEKFAESGEE